MDLNSRDTRGIAEVEDTSMSKDVQIPVSVCDIQTLLVFLIYNLDTPAAFNLLSTTQHWVLKPAHAVSSGRFHSNILQFYNRG
eukprot:SAG31_NODE_2769_length_5117_cov_1.964727_3_plen_83_part_00